MREPNANDPRRITIVGPSHHPEKSSRKRIKVGTRKRNPNPAVTRRNHGMILMSGNPKIVPKGMNIQLRNKKLDMTVMQVRRTNARKKADAHLVPEKAPMPSLASPPIRNLDGPTKPNQPSAVVLETGTTVTSLLQLGEGTRQVAGIVAILPTSIQSSVVGLETGTTVTSLLRRVEGTRGIAGIVAFLPMMIPESVVVQEEEMTVTSLLQLVEGTRKVVGIVAFHPTTNKIGQSDVAVVDIPHHHRDRRVQDRKWKSNKNGTCQI
jgi:hypothetical protein